MRDPARFWQESRMSALEIVNQGDRILALFRSGMDTNDISKQLGLRESVVYNLMHQAKRREFAVERTSCAN